MISIFADFQYYKPNKNKSWRSVPAFNLCCGRNDSSYIQMFWWRSENANPHWQFRMRNVWFSHLLGADYPELIAEFVCPNAAP